VFSRNNQQIAKRISEEVGRGITLWKAYGWYSKNEFEVLLVIGRKYDRSQIMKIIKETDERAFVSVSRAQVVLGEF